MTSGSPWTRPPAQPAAYPFFTRLSDRLHGWLDGRRGIPVIPGLAAEGANGSAARGTRDGDTAGGDTAGGGAVDGGAVDGDTRGGGAADSGTAGGSPPAVRNAHANGVAPSRPRPGLFPLGTPHIQMLSQQALERIQKEEISYREECVGLKSEYARFLGEHDALGGQLVTASERLERARRELTPGDLASRRVAEADAVTRPDDLVRRRRRAQWERDLARAERDFNEIAERHMTAAREAMLRQDLIRDRAAVARAAARRHSELAQRRIATYLQQLVRTHRQGPDLNMLLIGQPVGPELPEWVTSADDEEN